MIGSKITSPKSNGGSRSQGATRCRTAILSATARAIRGLSPTFASACSRAPSDSAPQRRRRLAQGDLALRRAQPLAAPAVRARPERGETAGGGTHMRLISPMRRASISPSGPPNA
jgi:hypothetical protein